jgi:CBS domain-containing protein
MTNRKLAYIVKDQKPLMLATHDTVQHACRCMRERRAGSVLVIDEQQRLSGIFTGRDAVRTLAEGKDAASTTLVQAMTPNPVTITPESRAIVSRGDFKGTEIDQLDEEDHLWECIR